MSVLGSGLEGQTGGTPPVVNDQANGGTPPVQTGDYPEFLKGVDPTLAADPSVKSYKNMNDFVKSFIHAQKAIGAEKVVVPQKGADEKVWGDVFRKLGLPEAIDKYDVARNDKSKLDEGSFNKLKEAMYKQGVLPHQAKALVGLLEEEASGLENALLEHRKSQVAENTQKLQQEWGQAFKEKATIAFNTAKKVGGDEFLAYLDQTGLGDDPQLIKIFAKIGESLGEKGLKGEGGGGAKTPAELQSRLDQLQKDKNSPYYDTTSPQHTAAKQEVESIYKMLYPQS